MIRFLGAALLLVILSACRHEPPPASRPPVSRIAAVLVRPAPETLSRTLLGQVAFDPAAYAQVMSRVPALSVLSIRAFAGDQVRKGETVLVLKSPDFLAAESELASILNNPGVSGKNHGLRLLAEQKLRLLGASEKEIGRLVRTRRPGDRYEVRSPLSGTIIRIGPSEGSQVKTGDILFEVSDLRRLWVQAFLYPGQERGIRPGARVSVSPLHEKGVTGTGIVERIAPFIDARTRTIPLRISLENPRGFFKPDAWVRIRVPVLGNDRSAAVLVPLLSVVRLPDRRTAVFILPDQGPPVPVPVTVLGASGKEAVVTGHLSAGQKVVTEGLLPLLAKLAK